MRKNRKESRFPAEWTYTPPAPRLLPSGVLALVAILLVPQPGHPQDPSPPVTEVRTIADDTYSDPEVEALIDRARSAKLLLSEGLSAYEARMWEHVGIGLTGSDFRRERSVFGQERRARIRWSAAGDHLLLWEAARRDVPIAGESSERDEEMADDLRQSLMMGGNALPSPLRYDPGSDELFFGRARFLSPIADSAAAHYRYYSDGRTLRIGLGESGETIVLAEVRVEPRRSDPRLVSASLWFEVASGALVRSSYRPARPFDLIVDRAGGVSEPDPSGFFSDTFLFEVNFVTVDHGLYDQRWWIPRRFAFQGVVRLGGLAQLPMGVEWTLDDVYVNDEGDLRSYLSSLSAELPPEWMSRQVSRGRGNGADSITIFLPPPGEMATLPPSRRGVRRGAGAGALSRSEAAALERALDEMERLSDLGRTFRTWRARDGALYFNRVEGFSFGLNRSHPIAPGTELGAEIRYGLSDEELGGGVGVVHRLSRDRNLSASIFRRVDLSSEWGAQKGVISSLQTLLFGSERTPFHRAWGIDLSLVDSGTPIRSELRLFFERHASVSRMTNTHLARLWSEDLLPLNPAASEGRWAGVSLDSRWEAGRDSRRVSAFGRVRAEAAGGTTQYFRGWTSIGAAFSHGEKWGSAVEGGVGGSAGELPHQRRFAPGGPTVFRGISPGEHFGESFWFARVEAGRGRPAARVVLFVDALELVPRTSIASFREAETEFAAGIGVSILDGLFRLDLARQLTRDGTGRWKVLLYRDGLF